MRNGIPDMRLVWMDVTNDWNFDSGPSMKPFGSHYIKSIKTGRIFNANLGVNLCELQPSYELWFFRTEIIWTHEFYDLSDEEQEDIMEYHESIISKEDNYEITYYHCRGFNLNTTIKINEYLDYDNNEWLNIDDVEIVSELIEKLLEACVLPE